MEKIKSFVVNVLNRAVAKYIKRNNIKVIAVAGSIGKTSTVSAVRIMLGQRYKVHQPKTAYNTNKSVHLEMFDLQFATSLVGWARVSLKILWRARGKADYEVLVVEIGTDHPGELQSFAWLKPEICVLTAVAPEHMEYFKTMEAVAQEEFSVMTFSGRLVANKNSIPLELVPDDLADNTMWYGAGETYRAAYYIPEGLSVDAGVQADFTFDDIQLYKVPLRVLGQHSLDALTAAGTVGILCGLSKEEIARGLQEFEPVKGRMQPLHGIQDSFIIDDSYNASPKAAIAALGVLYGLKAPQRIALLGNMNEMGEYSAQAHRDVGAYCDPDKLDLVVTIGKDANEYLAAAARGRGCTVKTFESPYDAGAYIASQLKPQAAILVKGSQNGVFAEEAIKSLLANAEDEARLVRQSDYWMDIKRSQFPADKGDVASASS